MTLKDNWLAVDMHMTVSVRVPDGVDPRDFWTNDEYDSIVALGEAVDECVVNGDFEIDGVRVNFTEEELEV